MLHLNDCHWKTIEELERKIRAYVHGGECEDVYTCPVDHEHRLDLEKSLAWSIADRLKAILKSKSEVEMEDFLKETLMLYATFKRRKGEYPEMTEYIKGIYRACKQKT